MIPTPPLTAKTSSSPSSLNSMSTPHQPVMIREVLQALSPQAGEIYIDGTFGAGGYTQRILEAAECKVYGIDRDPDAIARGQKLLNLYPSRLCLLEGRFGDMSSLLASQGITGVDGIVLDLGVSSPQLDQAERGFSFRFDGPLDMRMSRSGKTAADVVNSLPEADLADTIYNYGGERKSRRIASAIVRARTQAPITRTLELAELVRSVVGYGGSHRIDPATRTFQALRIYVNQETKELETALNAAKTLLNPGGKLVIVSFHSLEDQIAKHFIKTYSGELTRNSRHLPEANVTSHPILFRPLFRGVQTPQNDEINVNPRARSARLRAAVRLHITKEEIEL